VVWVRTETTSTASGATAQRAAAPHEARAARPAGQAPAAPRYRAVHDRVALDEIELYAELIIAAERSDERLSQQDIDRILGLTVRA
jgi:hypothetical protein